VGGKEFGIRFGQAQRAGVFNKDTIESATFELLENVGGVANEKVLDNLMKKGDGILVDAFVNSLLTA
jgi:hypothetical protein